MTVRMLPLAVILLLAGCAADPDLEPEPTGSSDALDPQGEAGDEAPELTVVVTVAPVADLVAQVGGDRVEVRSLVPPGADSHTYEPRPSDVAAIEEADVYVGIGLALNDAALSLAEATVGDDVPVVRLGEEVLDETQLVFDHLHGHGHGHGHDEGGDHGHSHDDGDDHGHQGEPGPNPHVWTSVRGAADLVSGIEELLRHLDPEGSQAYEQRAETFRAELADLDDRIAEATATIPDPDRTLVTLHDAWTYFARDYDLEFVTAIQPADHSEPSAAEIRDVIDTVRELDVPAVFGSEVFPSRVVDTIAAETGASYHGDLADDVLPGEPGDPEHRYVELMRRNAVTIVEGLGGDAAALR